MKHPDLENQAQRDGYVCFNWLRLVLKYGQLSCGGLFHYNPESAVQFFQKPICDLTGRKANELNHVIGFHFGNSDSSETPERRIVRFLTTSCTGKFESDLEPKGVIEWQAIIAIVTQFVASGQVNKW